MNPTSSPGGISGSPAPQRRLSATTDPLPPLVGVGAAGNAPHFKAMPAPLEPKALRSARSRSVSPGPARQQSVSLAGKAPLGSSGITPRTTVHQVTFDGLQLGVDNQDPNDALVNPSAALVQSVSLSGRKNPATGGLRSMSLSSSVAAAGPLRSGRKETGGSLTQQTGPLGRAGAKMAASEAKQIPDPNYPDPNNNSDVEVGKPEGELGGSMGLSGSLGMSISGGSMSIKQSPVRARLPSKASPSPQPGNRPSTPNKEPDPSSPSRELRDLVDQADGGDSKTTKAPPPPPLDPVAALSANDPTHFPPIIKSTPSKASESSSSRAHSPVAAPARTTLSSPNRLGAGKPPAKPGVLALDASESSAPNSVDPSPSKQDPASAAKTNSGADLAAELASFHMSVTPQSTVNIPVGDNVAHPAMVTPQKHKSLPSLTQMPDSPANNTGRRSPRHIEGTSPTNSPGRSSPSIMAAPLVVHSAIISPRNTTKRTSFTHHTKKVEETPEPREPREPKPAKEVVIVDTREAKEKEEAGPPAGTGKRRLSKTDGMDSPPPGSMRRATVTSTTKQSTMNQSLNTSLQLNTSASANSLNMNASLQLPDKKSPRVSPRSPLVARQPTTGRRQSLSSDTFSKGPMPSARSKSPAPGAAGPSQGPVAYVVVVGIGQYADRHIPPIPFMNADSRRVASIFFNNNMSVMFLTDTDSSGKPVDENDPNRPTKENILNAIAAQRLKATANSVPLLICILCRGCTVLCPAITDFSTENLETASNADGASPATGRKTARLIEHQCVWPVDIEMLELSRKVIPVTLLKNGGVPGTDNPGCRVVLMIDAHPTIAGSGVVQPNGFMMVSGSSSVGGELSLPYTGKHSGVAGALTFLIVKAFEGHALRDKGITTNAFNAFVTDQLSKESIKVQTNSCREWVGDLQLFGTTPKTRLQLRQEREHNKLNPRYIYLHCIGDLVSMADPDRRTVMMTNFMRYTQNLCNKNDGATMPNSQGISFSGLPSKKSKGSGGHTNRLQFHGVSITHLLPIFEAQYDAQRCAIQDSLYALRKLMKAPPLEDGEELMTPVISVGIAPRPGQQCAVLSPVPSYKLDNPMAVMLRSMPVGGMFGPLLRAIHDGDLPSIVTVPMAAFKCRFEVRIEASHFDYLRLDRHARVGSWQRYGIAVAHVFYDESNKFQQHARATDIQRVFRGFRDRRRLNTMAAIVNAELAGRARIVAEELEAAKALAAYLTGGVYGMFFREEELMRYDREQWEWEERVIMHKRMLRVMSHLEQEFRERLEAQLELQAEELATRWSWWWAQIHGARWLEVTRRLFAAMLDSYNDIGLQEHREFVDITRSFKWEAPGFLALKKNRESIVADGGGGSLTARNGKAGGGLPASASFNSVSESVTFKENYSPPTSSAAPQPNTARRRYSQTN